MTREGSKSGLGTRQHHPQLGLWVPSEFSLVLHYRSNPRRKARSHGDQGQGCLTLEGRVLGLKASSPSIPHPGTPLPWALRDQVLPEDKQTLSDPASPTSGTHSQTLVCPSYF